MWKHESRWITFPTVHPLHPCRKWFYETWFGGKYLTTRLPGDGEDVATIIYLAREVTRKHWHRPLTPQFSTGRASWKGPCSIAMLHSIPRVCIAKDRLVNHINIIRWHVLSKNSITRILGLVRPQQKKLVRQAAWMWDDWALTCPYLGTLDKIED